MNSINFIHILRAFAAFLIINSHSDKLYPDGLSFLGTGGSIGNAIFFFTSGYTLSLGIRKRSSNYLPWLWKRIVRLYPSFLVFTAFSFIFLKETYQWYNILFFNGSWFLQAIVIYYVIFFPLVRYFDKYLVSLLILNYFLFTIYFYMTYPRDTWTIDLMDNPTRIHWIYYFLVMVLGGIVSKSNSIFTKSGNFYPREQNLRNQLLFAALVVSIIAFYTPKLLFGKQIADGNIQYIYPLFLLVVTYAFYLLSTRLASILANKPISFVNNSIIFISYLTLDIYIVHFVIVHAIRDKHITFPINYIIALAFILLCAYLLNKLSNKLLDLLPKTK